MYNVSICIYIILILYKIIYNHVYMMYNYVPEMYIHLYHCFYNIISWHSSFFFPDPNPLKFPLNIPKIQIWASYNIYNFFDILFIQNDLIFKVELSTSFEYKRRRQEGREEGKCTSHAIILSEWLFYVINCNQVVLNKKFWHNEHFQSSFVKLWLCSKIQH